MPPICNTSFCIYRDVHTSRSPFIRFISIALFDFCSKTSSIAEEFYYSRSYSAAQQNNKILLLDSVRQKARQIGCSYRKTFPVHDIHVVLCGDHNQQQTWQLLIFSLHKQSSCSWRTVDKNFTRNSIGIMVIPH